MTDTALVTGGLGRSGRWIVGRLVDDGWSVVYVDLDHPDWEIDPKAGDASGTRPPTGERRVRPRPPNKRFKSENALRGGNE